MEDKPKASFADLKKMYIRASTNNKMVKLCYSGKNVKVKSLKVKDKKEFLKSLEKDSPSKIESTIDKIFEKCVETEDGNPIEPLLLTDSERNQLLLEIKRASFEEGIHKIKHKCPKCKKTNTVELNEDNFEVKQYSIENEMVVFEKTGVHVKIGPVMRKDFIFIDDYCEKNKITDGVEKEFITISFTIKNVYMQDDDILIEVSLSNEEKIDFVDNLSSTDYDKLLESLKQIKYGPKIKVDFKCEHCDFNAIQEIEIVDFFTY